MKFFRVMITIAFFGLSNLAGYLCANSQSFIDLPTPTSERQAPSEFARIVNAAEHIAVSFHRWEETDFK